MLSCRRGKPLVAAGAVAIAAAGVLGCGIAIASDAGGGVIHACASKRTGVLRVAAHCRSGELSVTWNQHGQPGLNGGRGPAGPSEAYIAVLMGATSSNGMVTTCTLSPGGATTIPRRMPMYCPSRSPLTA